MTGVLAILWLAGCAGVWLGALWAVFNLSKFRRKWLWAAATLPTYHLVPVGAAYVLLFAFFGPRPARRPALQPMDLPAPASDGVGDQ